MYSFLYVLDSMYYADVSAKFPQSKHRLTIQTWNDDRLKYFV
jgi:hypothetical protein